jgi:hypothetical protein
MSNWLALSLTVFLLADADIPRVQSFRPPANSPQTFPNGEEIPVLPALTSSVEAARQVAKAEEKNARGAKFATLQESSKLSLIRYVSGEFAKAVKPLPAGKEGFLVLAGKPLNQEQLDRAVATHGAAVNTGDNVQITKLDFHERSIVVDVNGGGRGKHHWRDHIQIGMGGSTVPIGQSTSTRQDQGPPGLQPGLGSTVFLEFPKSVPDLTPDDLKKLLSPFLDFSKERSASVHWIDTLPPEVKKAITERRATVGMDREEVIAAVGKPDRKVRERDAEGYDIEDWIYGTPPAKTVFVRFSGDRVTLVKEYPH